MINSNFSSDDFLDNSFDENSPERNEKQLIIREFEKLGNIMEGESGES